MLNDELKQRLAEADRLFQRQAAVAFLLKTIKYVAGLLLVLFVLDVGLRLGAWSRLGLALCYLTVILVAGAWMFYIARVRRNRLEQVARQLESRDPSLGSRLINYLQLGEQLQSTQPPELTRALAEQAIGDASSRMRGKDFAPLTKSSTLRSEARSALVAGLVVAVLLAVFFPISTLELLRFVDPFGDHPPYSATQIEILEPIDDHTQVAYNGSSLIKVRTSGQRSDDLYLSFYDPAKPGTVSTVPMYNKGQAGFYQAIENVKSDLVVFAHTKNGLSLSKKRRLNVVLTPKIERAFVEVSLPPYTGVAPRETALDFKRLSALVGSRIKIRLQSNRPLAGGTITTSEGQKILMTPSGENEVTGTMAATESTRLEFSVRDTAENASQENPAAPLTVTHDLPPDIAIDTPAEDGFVCDDFKLEARISASDDYGLKTIRIHRALNEVYSEPRTISFDQIVRSAAEQVDFDIKKLGVQPGDTISMFAEAVDTCPEPHLARTRTLRLTVISTDDYNKFVRERSDISDIQEKYAALLNEFHDRLDEQRQLADKIQKLQKKMQDDPAAAKDLAPQLDKLTAQQGELNKKLGDTADRMDHFVREKPLYDIESELKKTLTAEAAKIRDSVAQNDAALKAAMSSLAGKTNPEQQMQALAGLQGAAQKQMDSLNPAQQQATEQMMPALKDAALMNAMVNDFNAVKYLLDIQAETAAAAKAYEKRPDLTEEDKLALRQLAGTERDVQQALSKVVENLRQHAGEAEKTFPNAAQGARDLADKMENARLSPIAGQAANSMLAGDGAGSSALAERLRRELADLFEEVDTKEGSMCNSLDKYLRLTRNMNPGHTFQQMSESRKFGFGFGASDGSGSGDGGGLDGYAVSMGSNFGVFGNETRGGDPNAAGHGGSGQHGASPPGSTVDVDNANALSGGPTTTRPSNAVHGEAPIDEYRGVIEAYFNSITK